MGCGFRDTYRERERTLAKRSPNLVPALVLSSASYVKRESVFALPPALTMAAAVAGLIQ
jgi:hypothetical protein